MAIQRADQLADAMREHALVRFERRFEAGHVTGYVAGVGPKFFLMQMVGDQTRFDGFDCFRISDVRRLQPDPYSRFIEAALALRNDVAPRASIDLSNIRSLISSAASQFPLITVHTERTDPDVCWIGRPVGMNRGHLSLLDISPAAEWDDEPLDFALSSITRVAFGGGYEEALYLVGGEPALANRT